MQAFPPPRIQCIIDFAMALDRAGTPFIGRDEAITRLLAAAEAAREGAGSLVLLAGDPGIGKTRTLTELGSQARQDGMRVLVGRCLDGGGAAPFWPWAQIFRAWSEGQQGLGRIEELGIPLGVLAAVFPELRGTFPNLPTPSPLDEDAARFRLLDAAAAVLRRSARKIPLLVVLEDLHWADEGSLRLLSFVARDLSDAPLLLAASYRDADVDDAHPLTRPLADLARTGTTLALPGLDREAVAKLWTAATGAPPSAALSNRVCERTGGNPLFVLETARSLSAQGVVPETEVDEIPLPEGIRQALRPRVAQRSEACRRMLEQAAVVGEEFGLDLLQRMSATGRAGAVDLLPALAEATEARLVERCPGSEFRYRFAHALVRELLYDDAGPARQVALHGEVAAALEAHPASSDSHLAQLAHHACRAAPGGGAEDAIGHACRAAEEAASRWASEEAAHFYSRALDVLHLLPAPKPELHCDLLLARGQAETSCGRREAAVASLVRASELARECRDPERLARVALAFPAAHTSITMSASMGGERANALLVEALAGLPEGDSRERARVLARLARGDTAGAERAAEAVAMARRLGDRATLVLALDAQHYALWEPEHLRQRLAIAAELDRLGRETGNLFTSFRAGQAALGEQLELGDRRALRATLDRLDHLVVQLRQPALRLVPFHARACQTFLDGDFAEFERMIREALAIAQTAGGSDALAVFGGQLAMLRREQDRLAELLPALENSVARFPAMHTARISLAWALAEAGRLDDARAQLEPAVRGGLETIPRDGFVLLNLHLLGETAARVGDRELGAEVYERLLPYTRRAAVLGPVLCYGAVDRTLGQLAACLGQHEAAEAHFERALELDAAMEAIPCLAHSRIETARFMLDRSEPGDVDEARELLESAAAAAEAHGLRLAERHSRELLAGLAEPLVGAPTPVASPVDPGAENLLRREGDTWLLRFEGSEVRLQTSKGLECLAKLLREPGREWPALELAGSSGTSVAATTDDSLLDPQARSEYREQLASLGDELAEAERFHDTGRSERLREEIEFLTSELASSVGLGGRARRATGPSERARKAVYNRIRTALGKIRALHPELARHLEASVQTGHLCSYQPERPTDWTIG
jgi:tetratricopeptide (TPR) repeat protein